MLAAKGDQVANGGVVASLDVSAKELSSLGEADGVNGWGGGQDWMLGEDIAHGL